MPFTITAGVASDTGRVRAVNEDAWCLVPRLYAVADGMGGHAAGDRASWLAVDALRRLGETGVVDADAIQRSLADANDIMVTEAAQHHQARSMGTTVVGVAVISFGGTDHWLVFNVGDSRAYQYQNGHLDQISVDHSEVQELIDAGQLVASEAATHPRRNVVTRSLGTPDIDEADTWLLPMGPGQTFLLCSDGLPLEVTEGQIASILGTASSPAQTAQALVDAAVAAGGRDNVTALVVRTSLVEAESTPDASTGVAPDPDEDTIPRSVVDLANPDPGPGGSVELA